MKDRIETPARVCPVCRADLPISKKVAEPPEGGDRNMGVCAHCKSVLVMANDGSLREADLNDMMSLGDADRAILEKILEGMR